MSTPAKRRKKNDFQPSPQTVRSLDYFFGKQKQDKDLKPQKLDVPNQNKGRAETETESDVPNGYVNGSLTDEELARQMQDEWNEEDRKPTDKGDVFESSEVHGSNTDALENSDPLEEARQLDPDVPTAIVQDPVLLGTKTTLSLQSAASIEDNISTTIPFDENPLTFDPSQYLPSLKKHWAAEGGDAPYGLLTRCFILINSTQSRIKIVDTLVNFLRIIIEGDPDSLLPTVRHSP